MQRHHDWVLGRWAEDGLCEARAVVMEENSMTLPGGISCGDLNVSGSDREGPVVAGSSWKGAGDMTEVEIEITRSDEGLTCARGARTADLRRCE